LIFLVIGVSAAVGVEVVVVGEQLDVLREPAPLVLRAGDEEADDDEDDDDEEESDSDPDGVDEVERELRLDALNSVLDERPRDRERLLLSTLRSREASRRYHMPPRL
jgi:TATA-binding protein-associated factor Taf7